MPRVSEMTESKFVQQSDVGQGRLVTVQAVRQHDVSLSDAPTEMKWCLEFEDDTKPLVLNATNLHLMVHATGSDNTDDWIGHQVVLYVDKTVMFQGKPTGGIRIRPPKNQTQVESHAPQDADIPF